MKPYYECHITMNGNPLEIGVIVRSMGWIFSEINGDPDLGPGLKCYATKQYNGNKFLEEEIITKINTAASFLKTCGFDVRREKLEYVIYDKRKL